MTPLPSSLVQASAALFAQPADSAALVIHGDTSARGAALDSVLVRSPLPGGVDAFARWLFNLPQWLQIGGFVLGVLAKLGSSFVEHKAMLVSGLDLRTSVAGQVAALVFLFGIVAPLREFAKVAACWPAYRSRYFDEPYDGIVYASASSLGFAATESVYAGTLADFAADHSSYATGRFTWNPTDDEETRSFRFRLTVQDVPAAAGRSASFGFTWRTEAA